MRLDINGDPSGVLTDEGSRATLSWVTSDANYAYVSAYGLTTEQLVQVASTVSFDGTNVTLDARAGMQQIDHRPRMNTYDAPSPATAQRSCRLPIADVTLTVVTWNDMTVYEVGPAATVDVNGVPALVVTAGGPETASLAAADPRHQRRRRRPPARPTAAIGVHHLDRRRTRHSPSPGPTLKRSPPWHSNSARRNSAEVAGPVAQKIVKPLRSIPAREPACLIARGCSRTRDTPTKQRADQRRRPTAEASTPGRRRWGALRGRPPVTVLVVHPSVALGTHRGRPAGSVRHAVAVFRAPDQPEGLVALWILRR